MENQRNKTIIYIAGNVRSGSTLFERIIGNNKNIFSLGEMTDFLDVVFNYGELHDLFNTSAFDWPCSCGESIFKCYFWSDVIDELKKVKNKKEIRDVQKNLEALSGIFGLTSKKRRIYKKYSDVLFRNIFKKTTRRYRLCS